MYAKYIKQEIADLNGTGHTQAIYKMKTQAMSHDEFVDLCSREGAMPKDAIEGVLTLIHNKLALSMAEGFSVKINGLGTFTAKLGMRDGILPDAFPRPSTIRIGTSGRRSLSSRAIPTKK